MKITENALLEIIREETTLVLREGTRVDNFRELFRRYFNLGDARTPKPKAKPAETAKEGVEDLAERQRRAAARAAELANEEALYKNEMVKNAIQKANESLQNGMTKIVDDELEVTRTVVFRNKPSRSIELDASGRRIEVDPTRSAVDALLARAKKDGYTLTSRAKKDVDALLTALYRADQVDAAGSMLFSAFKMASDFDPLLKGLGIAGGLVATGGFVFWMVEGGKFSAVHVTEEAMEAFDTAADDVAALESIVSDTAERQVTGDELPTFDDPKG